MEIKMILSEDTNDTSFIRVLRDREGNVTIRSTLLYDLVEFSKERGELNGKYSINVVIVPTADLSNLIDELVKLKTEENQT